MNFDFNKFPLDVYNNPVANALLETIEVTVDDSSSKGSSVSQTVLAHYVKKAIGIGSFPFLVDKLFTWVAAKKMQEGISKLISRQKSQIERNPSSLLTQAQLNLMATYLITDFVGAKEAESAETAVGNFVKMGKKLFCLKNPLEVLWESAEEVTLKYVDICQMYHIAFLLTTYTAVPKTKTMVRKLIAESFCGDDDGKLSYTTKNRPVLFANVRYKTLEDNLTNRLDIMSQSDSLDKEIFDPVIKWRRETAEK